MKLSPFMYSTGFMSYSTVYWVKHKSATVFDMYLEAARHIHVYDGIYMYTMAYTYVYMYKKRSRTDCCMRRYVTCKRCQKSQNVANTSQNCCVGANCTVCCVACCLADPELPKYQEYAKRSKRLGV